jgi:hypothetical protein
MVGLISNTFGLIANKSFLMTSVKFIYWLDTMAGVNLGHSSNISALIWLAASLSRK